MKTIKLISTALLSACLCACANTWDDHYVQKEDNIDSNEIQSVATTVTEYLKSEPSLSTMYKLFDDNGVIETIKQKDQLFTILVVPNSINTPETDEIEYLAKSHISDIAISPSNLTNGQRVLMWNGKYLEVQKEVTDGETTISFNGIKVKKITKATNGFIYELESYVYAPKSLFEFISNLDDNYSIFREMVLSHNERTFDKAASIPTGVDNTGRTTYDSVFVITNPYFAAQGFDIMSESLTATVLIPSNTMVKAALDKARADLESWNMTRTDSIIENWVFQSAFFNKKLNKADLEETDATKTINLTSVFKKTWRTTVQKVDTDNPVDLSNGIAYYVTALKIPTNVLIFRLKDYFHYYENLTVNLELNEKELFYKETNLTFDKCNTDVTEWSGWPGYFPNIINRVLMYKYTDQTSVAAKLDFTPFKYISDGSGGHTVEPYMVPPGEYDLCLGFKQSIKCDIKVLFNDEVVHTITTADLSKSDYHYDRAGQGYPEFYDTNKATDKNKTKYDRDGVRVGAVTVKGDKTVPVKITFEITSTAAEGSRNFIVHHWCLRPTANCY